MIGKCFYTISFSQIHLIKVLNADDSGLLDVIEISAYIATLDHGIYINFCKKKIEDSWQPFCQSEFDTLYEKTYTSLCNLVDEYSGINPIEPDKYDKKIKYPKGLCFQSKKIGQTNYFKLLSAFDYERVTVKYIHIDCSDNCKGVYIFHQAKHTIDDSCVEMNRKQFTMIWKCVTVDFDSIYSIYCELHRNLYVK